MVLGVILGLIVFEFVKLLLLVGCWEFFVLNLIFWRELIVVLELLLLDKGLVMFFRVFLRKVLLNLLFLNFGFCFFLKKVGLLWWGGFEVFVWVIVFFVFIFNGWVKVLLVFL